MEQGERKGRRRGRRRRGYLGSVLMRTAVDTEGREFDGLKV
jgi:hypothetical protein